jgi:hypothetical protein
MPDKNTWLYRSLRDLPTTELRIVVTLAVYVMTAIAYFFLSFQPSWDWLAFIGLMSGLDIIQHIGRRVTASHEDSVSAPMETPNTPHPPTQ